MFRTSPPSLTLVYLMYDEEENIAAVLYEGMAFASAELPDWEIVVVDDGSSDGGAAVVEAVAAREPRVRLVRHPRNLGMGAAMRTGIEASTKEYFTLLPADGQIEAEELRKMVPLLAGCEVVLTIYERRADTLKRRVMSRMFRDYLMVAAGIAFELEGLYLYPTALAQEVLPQIGAQTFFFSFELIQHAVERRVPIATTTIVCKPRLHGESKVVSPRRIWGVSSEVWKYRQRRQQR